MAKKPARQLSSLEKAVIHRRLSVPLYNASINVIFADTATTGARWLANKFPKEGIDPEDYDDAAAFVYPIQRWPWVILPWNSPMDIIAHEAVHAAYEFHNGLGVRTSYGNQEPLAYLVGWITLALADLLADLNLERAKHLATLRNTEREFAATIAKVRGVPNLNITTPTKPERVRAMKK